MMISTRSILQTVTEISRALWWMFPSAKSGVKNKEGGTKSVSKDTCALKSAASTRSFPLFSAVQHTPGFPRHFMCIPFEPHWPGQNLQKPIWFFSPHSGKTFLPYCLDLQFPVWLGMKNQLTPIALCLNLSDQPGHTNTTVSVLNHSY